MTELPSDRARTSLWSRIRPRVWFHAGDRRRAFVRWARYPNDGAITPRWLRYLLVCTGIAIIAVGLGVLTATTKANFGPHDATYEVTASSAIVLDLGPLGTMQLDSPLPLGLGVRATIQEIPADLVALDPSATLGALGNDLAKYLAFFTAPNQTINLVAGLLIEDAAKRALIIAGVLLVVLGAVAKLLGPARRRELSYPLARNTWALTAGFLVIVLVVGPVTALRSRSNLLQIGAATSSVFADTPLEGARITGRLSGIIDTYGAQLMAVYSENEHFYERANLALAEAFDVRAALTARNDLSVQTGPGLTIAAPVPQVEPAVEPTTAPTGAPADDPAVNPGTDPTGGPVQAPTQVLPPPDTSTPPTESPAAGTAAPKQWQDPVLVTMLVLSDLHCNVDMAPLITTAAERSGAQLILNGGDTTINGTDLERFCVETFISAAPKGVQWIQADGNHDSAATSKQAAKAGATVLSGEIYETHGITFLGDSDPNETRLGAGSVSAHGETLKGAGERLADVACAAGNVDIMLIHNPIVGRVSLERGCLPYLISGHMHKRIGPDFVGSGIQYGASTTAGVIKDFLPIGMLKGTAEMTVLTYDTANSVMVSLQAISVTPQATATVGPILRFPQPGDNDYSSWLLPAATHPQPDRQEPQ